MGCVAGQEGARRVLLEARDKDHAFRGKSRELGKKLIQGELGAFEKLELQVLPLKGQFAEAASEGAGDRMRVSHQVNLPRVGVKAEGQMEQPSVVEDLQHGRCNARGEDGRRRRCRLRR